MTRENAPGTRWWIVVAAAVLVAGLALAFVAAGAVAHRDADAHRRNFEASAGEVVSTIKLDVQRSADLTVVITGWLDEHPTANNTEFAAWIDHIHAFDRYPEFEAAGFMVVVPRDQLSAYAADILADRPAHEAGQPFQVTPPGDRPTYCFTRLSTERDTTTSIPLGLDVCSVGTADRLYGTRDSATVSYEAVKYPGGTFLGIQTPVYRGGVAPLSVDERRAAFRGWLGTLVDPGTILSVARGVHPDLAVSLRYHSSLSDATFQSGNAPAHGTSTDLAFGNGWTATVTGASIARGITGNGAATMLLLAGVLVTLGAVALVVVLGTGRARAQRLVHLRTEELHHLALHDPLTGLANRTLIIDRLDNLLARSRRDDKSPAALYLDLDGFKAVNDGRGHEAGDELLRAVAARLTTAVREADTIGRLGGDEFVVLLEGSPGGPIPELVAERLIAVLHQPYEIGGESVVVSASIGIATGDRDSASELLRDADTALYRAKARGRDCYEVFDGQHGHVEDLSFDLDLRAALDADQLRLVYQPTYDLADLTLTGVEALLRWEHPTRGTVEPYRMIPVLERTGQIVEVGRWVLRTACEQMARWHAAGAPLSVSVNVSARQFETDAIVDDVRAALDASGLPPSSLTIEVTETTLMLDLPRAAECVRRIKALGVRIAIDDFGTGYSSLAYLRQLDVDTIKIDRSFISGMNTDDRDAIVRAIVQLGRDLGLTTLAEGVETTAQMDQLREEAVDAAQGYLFARPLDPQTLETTLLHQPFSPSSTPG